MTSDIGARNGAITTPSPEGKLRGYARLGKLDVYDYYLSMLVVGSAIVLPTTRFDPQALPMLAVFLLGEVCMIVALVAFDDLTGYSDGSDITNFTPCHRKLRKPLVAGTLTPAEALRFGWSATAAGAVLWLAALAVSPHQPLWTVVLMVVTYVVSVQYSYGIKLSYQGFQEAFIAALGWSLVLVPYSLATGHFSGFVLVQALLFGLGPLLFGVYSNTNDVEGDRSAGRPTVAALTTPAGNATFIGALSVGEFLIGAVASLLDVAPWWFVLLMLPATVLRVVQYLIGFWTGDIMRARKLGFSVHRVTVILLILANLLHGMTGSGW